MEASMELVVEADSIGLWSPAGKVVQTEVKNPFAPPTSAATSTSRKTRDPKNVKSAISADNFFLKDYPKDERASGAERMAQFDRNGR